jgi:hypothetical protein
MSGMEFRDSGGNKSEDRMFVHPDWGSVWNMLPLALLGLVHVPDLFVTITLRLSIGLILHWFCCVSFSQMSLWLLQPEDLTNISLSIFLLHPEVGEFRWMSFCF